jgi:glutamate-1-semialdehyde 2,1-aminomutase
MPVTHAGDSKPMTASLTDTRSAELYRRALKVLPGGVNSPVRAMRAIGRDPVFVARGAGAELTDVDGNRYVDYVCSWGPLIHGHAHPDVLAAVNDAAARGTSFGAPTAGELQLAEEVARRIPAVETLRMTSSGTEATMTALRLARAATGREQIVKFAGAYHGHVDGLLAQAGSGLATQGIPASPGVPAAAAAATIVVPWNDPEALVEAVQRRGSAGPAAIVAEPIPANMGLVPARDGFLELLRQQADASGALLVLDEVVTGFRVARGGAQELTGVQGDLVILGKVLGGGLPAAAVGGRRELIELLAPAGDVYQAGTLSGNPLAVAAGLATLALLDEQAYLRLAAITEQLAVGLREAAAERSAGHPIEISSLPGLLTVFFSDRPVRDLAGAQACDSAAHAAWCRGLLSRGVYPPPSQFEAWFPSLAHRPEHIERTVEAAAAAFRELG